MIKCHLSKLMGLQRIKISELARATGLNRNTITLLFKEEASRVELDTIEKLCEYFNCPISELFEYIPNKKTK
ncbi:helix-turn-helix domain-containing protein [Sulfurimonas sp.]